MPRLLIVTPSHSLHGGVERIIEALAKGLPDHGFEVVVGLAKGARWHQPDAFRSEYPGLNTVDIDGTAGTPAGRRGGVRAVLEQVRPDVVLVARLFDAYEALCERKALGDPVRMVVTVQAYEPEYVADLMAMGDWVDCCVTSGQLIRAAVRHFAPIPGDRVVSIPGGVRPATRFVEREAGAPIRLGYVGRLVQEQKRVLDLVGTLIELRSLGVPFGCRIAGTGPAERELREVLRSNGLERIVTLEGWKDPAALYADFYPNLDVVLHFAAWEGISIAPREAMAHGVVPVVARFLGLGYEGHFRADENCLTFPIGDIRSAAQHVKRLSEDTELWRRLSRSARESENGEWSAEGSLRMWARALEDTLKRPRTTGAESPPWRQPPSGRLARMVGEVLAARLRQTFGRRPTHPGPGGEWPHASGRAPLEKMTEILRFGHEAELQVASRSGS